MNGKVLSREEKEEKEEDVGRSGAELNRLRGCVNLVNDITLVDCYQSTFILTVYTRCILIILFMNYKYALGGIKI